MRNSKISNLRYNPSNKSKYIHSKKLHPFRNSCTHKLVNYKKFEDILLTLIQSRRGYNIDCNVEKIRPLIKNKPLAQCIKVIKQNYGNSSITVKIYDKTHSLQKVYHK